MYLLFGIITFQLLSSHLGFRTYILSLVLEMLINIRPYTVQSNKRWLLKIVKIIHS